MSSLLLPASDLGWMVTSPPENQAAEEPSKLENALPTNQIILKYKTSLDLTGLSAQAASLAGAAPEPGRRYANELPAGDVWGGVRLQGD
jgi:hypothetical protein